MKRWLPLGLLIALLAVVVVASGSREEDLYVLRVASASGQPFGLSYAVMKEGSSHSKRKATGPLQLTFREGDAMVILYNFTGTNAVTAQILTPNRATARLVETASGRTDSTGMIVLRFGRDHRGVNVF